MAADVRDSLDPRARIGAVRIAVADLDRAVAFYEQAIGLRTLDSADGVARLGPEGGSPILELEPDPEAPPRPPGTTGLFHFAILVPTRGDLAAALRRVSDAGWRFTGASDHLVSEALYLNDPEHNGIEIYRDRPREEWDYDGGQVRMATIPLNLDAVMADPGDAGSGAPMPARTTMGHVHLNVSDLASTERFYAGGLGLDVTVRGYPGALFLSAGGYHHHVGANTWAGEGASRPPVGALGLRSYEVVVPEASELDSLERRLAVAGADVHRDDGVLDSADPSGITVRAAVRE
jgi:catechol 2,3-dioxygenase